MFRIALRIRVRTPQLHRKFHATIQARIINPLLPFDVLDEVKDDELDEENKTLSKEKKRLIQQKKKIVKKYKEEKEKNNEEEDKLKLGPTVTKDITTEVRGLGWTEVQTGGGSGGPPFNNDNDNNNNNSNNNKNDKDKEEEKKEEEEEDEKIDPKVEEEETKSSFRESLEKLGRFLFKCFETIGITLSSVGILALSGYMYHQIYNRQVLEKMGLAFESGDPAYQLAVHNKTNKRSESEGDGDSDLGAFWVDRPQQKLLDDIVSGRIRGRYFLVVGEKGTGKTTLIMEAMKKIEGRNVAIFDAHADPEIFRIRLGRALNFAYSEDYIGSLFSMRGPRDTTALLDIERAFNKLETLAIERRMLGKSDKPLIMIINNLHLIKENEEGVKLLELLQQKAEGLSGSELVTIVFNSDDYWVYEKLKRLGTRLELINVRDLSRVETVKALQFIRGKYWPFSKFPDLRLDEAACHKVYDLIGGRPQHISQVARHKDVINACHEIIDREKTWFLNQCGLLGEEMDDDVMEFGKFATSAMFLMRAFVEMDRQRMNTLIQSKGEPSHKESHHLPELPLWRARQIMTRPDYIQQYDNLNIFTVDSDLRVRADSVPMMRAFHEIASQPHFDELLENTSDRVAAIESLGRTRELVMKDLVHGQKYEIVRKGEGFSMAMDSKAENDDETEDLMLMEEVSKSEHRKKWWERRMGSFDELYLPREPDPGDSKQG